MKLIFFTYDFPYPTNSGGKVRSYNLLKFSKHDIDITLFSFVRDGFNNDHIQSMRDLGIKNIKIFKRRKLKDPKNIISVFDPQNSIFKRLYYEKSILKELEETIERENIDVVHFESFYTSFYINDLTHFSDVKLIFGTENIEHFTYGDYASNLAPKILKPFYSRESKKIKEEEEDLLKKADITLSVTESEADYIRKLTNKKCYVIENGIDLDNFKFKQRKKKDYKNLLFIGNFTYFPNVYAMRLFFEKVYDKIKDKNIKITIIGKNASRLKYKYIRNVFTLEFVDNIQEAYDEADIFISPVQYGGGTNFKILESMATGVPVVAYKTRADDLGAENNKHVFTAENEESFATQIIKVLEEKELAGKISLNARKFVEENYSWEKIGEKLNTIWKEQVK